MLRSGVIAKKVGMTRLFMEDGKQIPVTVLQLDNLQVVAQRTADKDGYSAVQLGAGTAKAKRVSAPMRGHFAAAKVEPKRKIAEFRVAPENLIGVGEEITANHYFEGQFVDVSGTSIGKGFAGCDEAAQLRRSARVARCVDQPPLARLDRSVSGPRPGVQGQEDGRSHGGRPRHHAEPAGRQDRCRPWPDHGQGRGSRLQRWLGHDQGRGQKADARERDLSRRAEIGCRRSPAHGRRSRRSAPPPRRSRRSRRRRRSRRSRGRVACSIRGRCGRPRRRKATNETRRHQTGRRQGRFGRSGRGAVRPRAARRHPAPRRPLAAQQRAGRHAQGQDPVRDQLFDQEDLSPEGHRRRTPRRPQRADLPRGWYLQGSDPAQPWP